MVEQVDLVFNYGGRWILKPKLSYLKFKTEVWHEYEVDFLSYIDICSEFTERMGFKMVKQVLILGPDGGYYTMVGDEDIRKLQSLLCEKFKVLQLFALDDGEVLLHAPSINQFNDTLYLDTPPVDTPPVEKHIVDVRTDCDSSDEEVIKELPSDYDNEELEQFRKERSREVTAKLDNFLELKPGMSFRDLNEAKRIVGYYAVANRRGLWVQKSDKGRVSYKCQAGCPFRYYISKCNNNQGFMIKTLNSNHNCDLVYSTMRATPNTLAHYFKNKVQGCPKYKVKEMRVDMEQQFKINVSYSKMKRVKKQILEKLEGSYIDDFNRLEAYAQELRESNPGSDIVINISKDVAAEGKRRFLRMYLCFNALKQGWKATLRPLIGLDGTFMKGQCKGQLLVAMAQDSSNHFYPLAWAVVDKETGRTWKWFLELLRSSLDLVEGQGLTIMSDMQKGLLDAVSIVLPSANQRFCARHVEANWGKRWRGKELKKLMWWSAWSTYEEEFKDQLKNMGVVSKEAVEELLVYPPQCWCRAYFDTTCKNNMVDNNFTESFNAWILEARFKPIIRMLEEIRVKVMKMLHSHEVECTGWKGEFSPYASSLYNDFREIAQGCYVDFNRDDGYEVTEGEDRHTVNLDMKSCTCRAWDLTGIPCPHAIKALLHSKVDPLSEVNWWYSKECYLMVYEHKLKPVRGDKFWKVEPQHAMDPPLVTNNVGRPKVKRKREKDEAKLREGLWKYNRKGVLQTCGYCSAPGHNMRKCPLVHGRHKHFFQEPDCSPNVSAPNDSQQSEFVFMPTPGISKEVASDLCSQTDAVTKKLSTTQLSNQQSSSSNRMSTQPSSSKQVPPPPFDDASEDSEPELRPMVISEAKTRLQQRKLQQKPTGTRKIPFVGNGNGGVTMPNDLPFEAKKMTWKGKKAMSTNQLIAEKEQRIGKLKCKRAKK